LKSFSSRLWFFLLSGYPSFQFAALRLMTKTLRLLSLAALLATGTATATLAAGSERSGSQAVTGTQLGSPQTNTPATGSAAVPNAGMSAQTTGPQYPGVVGPTGSRQRDATNPNRSAPTAGGGTDGAGGGGGGCRREPSDAGC